LVLFIWTLNNGWLGRYGGQYICWNLAKRLSYHIVDLKRQNRLKVGTNRPQLKVKMESVLDDDVRKKTS